MAISTIIDYDGSNNRIFIEAYTARDEQHANQNKFRSIDDLLFDTGAEFTLLNRSTSRICNTILTSNIVTCKGVTEESKSFRGEVGIVPVLILGDLAIYNLPVIVPVSNSIKDAILGNDILKHFNYAIENKGVKSHVILYYDEDAEISWKISKYKYNNVFIKKLNIISKVTYPENQLGVFSKIVKSSNKKFENNYKGMCIELAKELLPSNSTFNKSDEEILKLASKLLEVTKHG